jgi:hypothetical protein
MTHELHDMGKVWRIYLRISRFPILATTIRERMRHELFMRGIVDPKRFEEEVKEEAIESQRREGLVNPYTDEPSDIWERRLSILRDQRTDYYFAYNLPLSRFDDLAREVLKQRRSREEILSLNPELAPWEWLFQQAEEYEALPPEERTHVQHHLQEIKVVLIRAMISEQLQFVRIAKEYLDIEDLKWIRSHRIGTGKIGGKAAGLMLAWKILQKTLASQGVGRESLRLVLPDSYFLGADVFYEHQSLNNLSEFMNQKYKPLDQIRDEYPMLLDAYLRGDFPEYVILQLRELLDLVGHRPLIVRSSSLLEDNFDVSFAGIYESVFCPNQGTPEENLVALIGAIARVYASFANPNALFYRKQKGLLDYDERMAVMIQPVQGEHYRDFFFPMVAGMAYSRNPFIWNAKLRREDGFIRMVTGMGTRAVERVGEDYPRMLALSHPQLRPESGSNQIRHYSQYYMDVIDLQRNKFDTRRIGEVLGADYPNIRLLASIDQGDYITQMVFNDQGLDPNKLVMTFDGLISQTAYVDHLKWALKALEFGYGRPVDIEFTLALGREYPRPSIELHLLQCRAQSVHYLAEEVRFPEKLAESDIIFGTEKLVPTGRVRNIDYIVYVDPEKYMLNNNPFEKLEVGRLIGRINQRLEGKIFILMGPGRWGSNNADLGVKVGYADIYNSRALVEIGWGQGPSRPTLSYGTHFFQDLVEAHIYPLAIFPGEQGNPFRQAFFNEALNALPALLPDDARYAEAVKVIDVSATTGGRTLELVMSGEEGRALAFLI